MSKKVVLTLEDVFYEEFKEVYGRPGKPMTQIILDKMYEILKKDRKTNDQNDDFYECIDSCLQDVQDGEKKDLGECKTAREIFEKLGIEI